MGRCEWLRLRAVIPLVGEPDGMYTLYYSPGTASMCVHQALIEANAQYRLVLVDLQAGQQRDPAYPRLNPGRGPHADHADALVAEHAKAGDRVAGPASVCRADESSPELEEALRARRTERVELKIGADYER